MRDRQREREEAEDREAERIAKANSLCDDELAEDAILARGVVQGLFRAERLVGLLRQHAGGPMWVGHNPKDTVEGAEEKFQYALGTLAETLRSSDIQEGTANFSAGVRQAYHEATVRVVLRRMDAARRLGYASAGPMARSRRDTVEAAEEEFTADLDALVSTLLLARGKEKARADRTEEALRQLYAQAKQVYEAEEGEEDWGREFFAAYIRAGGTLKDRDREKEDGA